MSAIKYTIIKNGVPKFLRRSDHQGRVRGNLLPLQVDFLKAKFDSIPVSNLIYQLFDRRSGRRKLTMRFIRFSHDVHARFEGLGQLEKSLRQTEEVEPTIESSFVNRPTPLSFRLRTSFILIIQKKIFKNCQTLKKSETSRNFIVNRRSA